MGYSLNINIIVIILVFIYTAETGNLSAEIITTQIQLPIMDFSSNPFNKDTMPFNPLTAQYTHHKDNPLFDPNIHMKVNPFPDSKMHFSYDLSDKQHILDNKEKKRFGVDENVSENTYIGKEKSYQNILNYPPPTTDNISQTADLNNSRSIKDLENDKVSTSNPTIYLKKVATCSFISSEPSNLMYDETVIDINITDMESLDKYIDDKFLHEYNSDITKQGTYLPVMEDSSKLPNIFSVDLPQIHHYIDTECGEKTNGVIKTSKGDYISGQDQETELTFQNTDINTNSYTGELYNETSSFSSTTRNITPSRIYTSEKCYFFPKTQANGPSTSDTNGYVHRSSSKGYLLSQKDDKKGRQQTISRKRTYKQTSENLIQSESSSSHNINYCYEEPEEIKKQNMHSQSPLNDEYSLNKNSENLWHLCFKLNGKKFNYQFDPSITKSMVLEYNELFDLYTTIEINDFTKKFNSLKSYLCCISFYYTYPIFKPLVFQMTGPVEYFMISSNSARYDISQK